MSAKPEDPSAKTKERKSRTGSLKGTFVGNYEILHTIGEGSFAKVAIKIIDKTKLPDDYAVKNMYREAQILRILDHPNIIKLFEVMETKKSLFLILEYASGGEFLEYIISHGRLDESEAKSYTKQLISALEHSHSHNIVHRDLKAENFLLDANMELKISDFGLSNFYDSKSLLQTCCGSPVYSAPELIEGKKYTGPEVDVWSLGINVYAMVVGDLPFADANLSALYDSILKGKYKIPDFVSADCRDFISKLLVINPKKRSTLAQLYDHPWLSSTITFLEPLSETFDPFRPKDETQMDTKVLDTMEQMGLDRKTTVQSVLTGKFNQAAGLYFLLSHHKLYGTGGQDFKISSMSLQNISRDGDTNGKEGKDISEELAAVLFQYERARAPTKPSTPETRLNTTYGRPGKSHVSKVRHTEKERPNSGALSDSQVVPLPPVPGAIDIQSSTLKGGAGNVNIKDLKTQAGLDQLTYMREDSITTRFGLTKHSGGEKHIPIDESLYQPEAVEKGMPRTIKFAFNCICHNQLQPSVFFARLYTILDKNDIQWYNNDYLCVCEWGDIRFEIEICKLPRQYACGIRMKRISGDIWEFKKLSSKLTLDLEGVTLQAEVDELAKGYLWHQEPIQLAETDGLVGGKTVFGENIEDEWFIVWILKTLTERRSDLLVSISDNDGEFLLIEAAEYLPPDLEPSQTDSRVFIFQGRLHLIPLDHDVRTLQSAQDLVRDPRRNTFASPAVQDAAFARLRAFAANPLHGIHHARVLIPHQAAHILSCCPGLVSLAAEAFHTRDASTMKFCSTMSKFPPQSSVPMTVTMTRHIFAQLKSSRFVPPAGFRILPPSDALFEATDLGAKLACGFEMLSGALRNNTWRTNAFDKFLAKLEELGFFEGELEGSARYGELLGRARTMFDEQPEARRSRAESTFLELLEAQDLIEPERLPQHPADSSLWMEMDVEEVDKLLDEKQTHFDLDDDDSLSDLEDEEREELADMRNIVDGFEGFINKKSGIKGALFPGEHADSDPDSDSDSDDEDIRPITFNPDLFLSVMSSGLETGRDSQLPVTVESYMDAMDSELANTRLADDFERDGDAVDTEATLLKNVYSSMAAQQGLAGPASSIIGSLGLRLPKPDRL
ncbi:Map microtubule affinity-regulating kinase [Kappamyces sp. JEL0829]|nr:Map microtubule affinity-regulating kinase [Kappamyces sp. JEL0829]